jgi:UDP-N-acetylglucosamine--N-acetylmuramyl-(pentapeptide) pyrophosphoryl-undecaprenol N-acetylglucosamine transferase
MDQPAAARTIAIACGGTGGHLFPGIAVAEQLRARGASVTLLISPKDVDQQAVRGAKETRIEVLPAVASGAGRQLAFVRGFVKSFAASRRLFRAGQPDAVLAMGGFTSAPPVLAGKRRGVWTFLHESNTVPGRANRWLSWIVDQAFVGFAEAAPRLHTRRVTVSGTPVRPQFRVRDAAACRATLGLDPRRPVLLVMGGSQGATGINELVLHSLPVLLKRTPELQWLHLTGAGDFEKVKAGYAARRGVAVVRPFLAEMELALGAATAAVSRAGASSLAELAAMRVPAVLIPFPAAADNHQFHNARAFERTGAARLLEQVSATPHSLAQMVLELLSETHVRDAMRGALSRWHAPRAAEEIAVAMLNALPNRGRVPVGEKPAADAAAIPRHQSAPLV